MCYVNDWGLVLCVVGIKVGSVWFLWVVFLEYYLVEKFVFLKMFLFGEIFVYKFWLIIFSWGICFCIKDIIEDIVVLVIGSFDGRYVYYLLFSIIIIKIINIE